MTSAASAPAPTFGEPKEYAVADEPDALVAGDLNGDGKPDLVTANGKVISVLLNRGDGALRPRRDYPARGDNLAIGDLNGDSRLDLATTAATLRNPRVSVLFNDGNGGFRAKRDYRTGRGPTSVAIGDLNGDRKLDLATANMYSPPNSKVYTASVLLNRGRGRFRAPRDFRTGDHPEAIEIGDVNGDRKSDLVTANEGDTVSVLLNRGGGRFRGRRDYRTGPSPTDLGLADLNADGKLDLVTPNLNSIDTGLPRISVLINRGAGSFRMKRDYRTGWIYSVTIADLNNDHNPDLVIGSVSGFPSVLLNRGDGSFQAMLQYRVQARLKYDSAGGEWAAVSDFNGDGRADLAASNMDGNAVSVLTNTPGLCNVQDVRRMTLQVATRRLARVNCSVGEVQRDYSEAFKSGFVIRQKPPRGVVRPHGDKVDLVVSLGRKG